ncbi:MAG TPA: hypothetical protein VEH31_38100, partial [Streptosporangiaceae bacterium]|nr:hypothetical protein [Streptosporangiaceae bacterium]
QQRSHEMLPPLHRLRPDLPQEVTALIRRALEKRRERRWQNGGDFRRALLATIAGGARPARATSRWRGWVVAAVAALVLLWASFGIG